MEEAEGTICSRELPRSVLSAIRNRGQRPRGIRGRGGPPLRTRHRIRRSEAGDRDLQPGRRIARIPGQPHGHRHRARRYASPRVLNRQRPRRERQSHPPRPPPDHHGHRNRSGGEGPLPGRSSRAQCGHGEHSDGLRRPCQQCGRRPAAAVVDPPRDRPHLGDRLRRTRRAPARSPRLCVCGSPGRSGDGREGQRHRRRAERTLTASGAGLRSRIRRRPAHLARRSLHLPRLPRVRLHPRRRPQQPRTD